MPIQLYSFDPKTGLVRAVADDFDKCNGLAFSADGTRAYVYDDLHRFSFDVLLTLTASVYIE